MLFDDFVKDYYDLEVEGHLLRDAMVFKMPKDFITRPDILSLAKKVGNYFQAIQKQLEAGSTSITSEQIGQHYFHYDLSVPPYDNVVYLFKDDCKETFLWHISLGICQKDELGGAMAKYALVPVWALKEKALLPWVIGPEAANNPETGEMVDVPCCLYPRPSELFRIDYYQDLDKSGRPLGVDLAEMYLKRLDGSLVLYSHYTRVVKMAHVFVALKTNALLNCRNIKINKFEHSQELQRARKKRGKLPLVSYHTIEIKQMMGKKGNRRELWTNRIHLCRGHFKHYTEENPLFGKYVGLWWWQPSVRGRNQEGMVVKDYAVKANQEVRHGLV